MVRSELLQKFCNEHPQLLRKDLEKILETIFLQILEALSRGENIEIRLNKSFTDNKISDTY